MYRGCSYFGESFIGGSTVYVLLPLNLHSYLQHLHATSHELRFDLLYSDLSKSYIDVTLLVEYFLLNGVLHNFSTFKSLFSYNTSWRKKFND